jgi:hypothetical protein
MKRTLVYFLFSLPFLAMLGGCLKESKQDSTPLPKISGLYTGQFVRLRLNQGTNKYDTLRANVSVNFDLTTGYTLSGDPALAASNGDYSYDAFYFQFNDKTYPTTGYPTKPHLAGLYIYGYDGTTLQLKQTYPLDTLGYFYNLKKSN